MTLVLEQRVVHLPEAPLQAGGVRGRGEHAGTRVLRGHGEVPEHPRDGQLFEDEVCRGAVGALEVGVLDHHRAAAADVVAGPGSGGGALLQGVEDEVGTGDLERAGTGMPT